MKAELAQECRTHLTHRSRHPEEIHDGPVHLELIFRAKLWSQPHAANDMATLVYRKMIEVAGETVVEREVCWVRSASTKCRCHSWAVLVAA